MFHRVFPAAKVIHRQQERMTGPPPTPGNSVDLHLACLHLLCIHCVLRGCSLTSHSPADFSNLMSKFNSGRQSPRKVRRFSDSCYIFLTASVDRFKKGGRATTTKPSKRSRRRSRPRLKLCPRDYHNRV